MANPKHIIELIHHSHGLRAWLMMVPVKTAGTWMSKKVICQYIKLKQAQLKAFLHLGYDNSVAVRQALYNMDGVINILVITLTLVD